MKILTYRLGVLIVNCYLVYDEKSNKACLIDPAVYDAKIIDVILSNRLMLEYIILTHGHFDHICGLNAFKEKTGTKFAAHEFKTEYLENPNKSMTGGETDTADIGSSGKKVVKKQ